MNVSSKYEMYIISSSESNRKSYIFDTDGLTKQRNVTYVKYNGDCYRQSVTRAEEDTRAVF